MKKTLFSYLIFLSTTISCFSQTEYPVIISKASREEISVKSNLPVHIRVRLRKGNVWYVNKIFAPGKEESINKYFTKKKIRKTTIHLSYDNAAYANDMRIENRTHAERINAIDRSRATREKSIEDECLYRIAGELAANANNQPSKYWVINILQKLSEFGGKLSRTYYELKDTYRTFNSKNYSSYEEVLLDLAKMHGEDKLIEKYSNMLQQAGVFNEKTNKGIIKALFFLDQELRAVPSKIEEAKRNERSRHEKYLYALELLKKDPYYNRSYKASKVLPAEADLRSITPNISLNAEVNVASEDLNTYWRNISSIPKDSLKPANQSDIYLDFRLRGNLAVSPEMRLGKNLYSKFYLDLAYQVGGYYLLARSFEMSNSFVTENISKPLTFNKSSSLRYYRQTYFAGLTYRLIQGSALTLDMSGGGNYQQGYLDLTELQPFNKTTWKNTRITIPSTTFSPYFGLQIGLGFNVIHSGLHLTASGHLYESQNIESSVYKVIYFRRNRDIPLNSSGWRHDFSIGMRLSF